MKSIILPSAFWLMKRTEPSPTENCAPPEWALLMALLESGVLILRNFTFDPAEKPQRESVVETFDPVPFSRGTPAQMAPL